MTDKVKQAAVLKEVEGERDYQDKLWNNTRRSDDTSESESEASFVGYINEYANNETVRGKTRSFRERMIKVAALAVAAIERNDRVNGG